MRSCRCKNVGVRQVTRQPNGGWGGGRGSRPRTLHPVPPLLLLGVRYLMGNIGFSLCLTLVTIRITPFFKYKFLAISKYDVNFAQFYILYLVLAELGQLSGVAAILRFPMPDIADDEGSADSEED